MHEAVLVVGLGQLDRLLRRRHRDTWERQLALWHDHTADLVDLRVARGGGAIAGRARSTLRCAKSPRRACSRHAGHDALVVARCRRAGAGRRRLGQDPCVDTKARVIAAGIGLVVVALIVIAGFITFATK